MTNFFVDHNILKAKRLGLKSDAVVVLQYLLKIYKKDKESIIPSHRAIAENTFLCEKIYKRLEKENYSNLELFESVQEALENAIEPEKLPKEVCYDRCLEAAKKQVQRAVSQLVERNIVEKINRCFEGNGLKISNQYKLKDPGVWKHKAEIDTKKFIAQKCKLVLKDTIKASSNKKKKAGVGKDSQSSGSDASSNVFARTNTSSSKTNTSNNIDSINLNSSFSSLKKISKKKEIQEYSEEKKKKKEKHPLKKNRNYFQAELILKFYNKLLAHFLKLYPEIKNNPSNDLSVLKLEDKLIWNLSTFLKTIKKKNQKVGINEYLDVLMIRAFDWLHPQDVDFQRNFKPLVLFKSQSFSKSLEKSFHELFEYKKPEEEAFKRLKLEILTQIFKEEKHFEKEQYAMLLGKELTEKLMEFDWNLKALLLKFHFKRSIKSYEEFTKAMSVQHGVHELQNILLTTFPEYGLRLKTEVQEQEKAEKLRQKEFQAKTPEEKIIRDYMKAKLDGYQGKIDQMLLDSTKKKVIEEHELGLAKMKFSCDLLSNKAVINNKLPHSFFDLMESEFKTDYKFANTFKFRMDEKEKKGVLESVKKKPESLRYFQFQELGLI